MKSIICIDRRCFKCGTDKDIHRHHIMYGSANRKKSEEDGLWVYLCGNHHNLSGDGVHFNKDYDLRLKQMAQRRRMDFYGKSEDQFIKRYGKSYIME